MRRAFILELALDVRTAGDLSAGGVFIPNAFVEFDDECSIVLRAGGEELTVVARAVQVMETGAGFQIEGMTRELRERIVALLEIAKHIDFDRKKTLTRALAAAEPRRSAAGSIPPGMRRGVARVAEGSIPPMAALTQRDDTLAEKARLARETDDNTDFDDD